MYFFNHNTGVTMLPTYDQLCDVLAILAHENYLPPRILCNISSVCSDFAQITEWRRNRNRRIYEKNKNKVATLLFMKMAGHYIPTGRKYNLFTPVEEQLISTSGMRLVEQQDKILIHMGLVAIEPIDFHMLIFSNGIIVHSRAYQREDYKKMADHPFYKKNSAGVTIPILHGNYYLDCQLQNPLFSDGFIDYMISQGTTNDVELYTEFFTHCHTTIADPLKTYSSACFPRYSYINTHERCMSIVLQKALRVYSKFDMDAESAIAYLISDTNKRYTILFLNLLREFMADRIFAMIPIIPGSLRPGWCIMIDQQVCIVPDITLKYAATDGAILNIEWPVICVRDMVRLMLSKFPPTPISVFAEEQDRLADLHNSIQREGGYLRIEHRITHIDTTIRESP